MFTSGRILFLILFLVSFIGYLIWSYRKDSPLHKIHFRKPYRVLLVLIGFFSLLFLIVKLRKFL